MVAFRILVATSLLLISNSLALPAQPKSTSVAELSPVQWKAVGPNYYLPGSSPTTSLIDTLSPTPAPLAKRADSDPQLTPVSGFGLTIGNIWRLNSKIQVIAISLLSQYYETVGQDATSTADQTSITETQAPTTTETATTTTTTTTTIPTTKSKTTSKTSSKTTSKAAAQTTSKTTTRATTTVASKSSSALTASQTGGNGLGDGATFWNLKSVFTSIGSFTGSVALTQWLWGEANGSVVQGVPKSAWAVGVAESNNQSAFKVVYPAGSYSPGNLPIGGAGFYSDPLDLTSANNVSFAYSVFFPVGFDFVKGGKLPGLWGGAKACSGGSTAENCFSTRLMWRTGGLGELYFYAPREKQVDAFCTLPPLSFCNSIYGMSIGRGSWTFKTGEWTNIRQDLWLNTPGVADGGIQIWVNGQIVLRSTQVYYRNSPVGNLANGTAPAPIPLINYDDIPDNVIIPNGGFKADPTLSNTTSTSSSATPSFTVSLATKLVGTGTQESSVVETVTATVEPYDWENKKQKKMKRRSVVLDKSVEPVKRATTLLPITIEGMKWDTFYGGSTVSYAPTIQQTAYFNQFGLRIRS